jgi:hypothetical protein
MPWRSVDQVYDYVLSEGSPAYYQEFITRFPTDPRCDRIRHLLFDLTQAAAWHQAVLANSPLAYKNFYEHHADGPYAKMAMHLEQQPKGMPLMQAGHLFKGNAGLRQMQLSTGAKITTMPVHGASLTGNGKVVNLPVNNKGAEHELGHHEVEHHEISHDTNAKPREHFERRDSLSTNHFSNSQARMGGGIGGGGGMHLMGRGGGGFGRHR